MSLARIAGAICGLAIVVSVVPAADGLRIRGKFSTEEFFGFLVKFGFQKTEQRDSNNTQGYIYGNVSLSPSSAATAADGQHLHSARLVVVDRGYFLEFYGNRSLLDKRRACHKMLGDKISSIAYDVHCHDTGEQDFLRSVPCPDRGLCTEEDNPGNVVKGAQFTYRILDYVQSRFWYVSLVACRRDPQTCQWEPVEEHYELDYDIWLVNGNPATSGGGMAVAGKMFRHQYSYDIQEIFCLYIFLLVVYVVLIAVQASANRRQNHPITRLLAGQLAVEFAAIAIAVVHNSIFSVDGYGLPWLDIFGDILEIFAQSLFMLLLLLLAMGWAVTRQELRWKTVIFAVWLIYSLLHCALYVWKKLEIDVIEDVDEYDTIPGVLVLILRMGVIICFMLSLWETMRHEHNPERLQFFLHFGAASLVWFIYLPIMAGVALNISALWRKKFVEGVTYSADTFAVVVLIHLYDPSSELEELYEAPNHVQKEPPSASVSRSSTPRSARLGSKKNGKQNGEIVASDAEPVSQELRAPPAVDADVAIKEPNGDVLVQI